MAISHLGFAVDSSQAVKASSDLAKLTKSSASAEKAAASLQRGAKTADAAVGNLGRETERAAAGTRTLAQASNVASAAQQRLAANSNMAMMQSRNLAFQFQDIGTMLVAGQSPFMLLAQQLPQVTMYGGQLNGVMGALKSTLSGLFSPLGLLTTGFVIAGSAAISYFTSATDEAEEAAKALEEQNDLIRNAADNWGDAIPLLREYADEIDRLKQENELSAAVQELSNRAWEEARSILPQVRTEIGGIAQELIRAGDTSAADGLRDAFNAADRAAQDLRQAIADGTAETADFDRVTSALASLMANEGVQGADDLQKMIGELRDRYGEAADEALRLAQAQEIALATAAAHEANRGRFDKTGQRLGEGSAAPLSPNEFMRRFGLENIIDFPSDRKKRRGQSDAERAADNYERMIQSGEQFIAAQRLEAEALGITEQAAQALRFEQDMLNQAANDNISLTASQRTEISQLANSMAAAEAETNRLKETQEALQQAGQQFGSLLRGLVDGTMDWKDALSQAIPIVLRLLSTMNGGFGDGFFGSLLTSFFGFEKGAAFQSGNVIPFARGGIVSQPTVFPFAKGVGLMGEAGPEAVMPLRRGPGGRLGVEAANTNQRVTVDARVFVDENGNWQAEVERIAEGPAAQAAGAVARAVPSMVDARTDERQTRRIRPRSAA